MTNRSAWFKLTTVRLRFVLLLLSTIAFVDRVYADDFVHENASVVAVRPGEVDVAPTPRARIDQGVVFSTSRLLGSIVALDGETATVKLPMDVRVHVGDRVRLANTSGGGVDVISKRLSGLSVSGEVGLYDGLPLGDFSFQNGGVQTTFSAAVVYRLNAPIAVHARLEHASLAFTKPKNIAAVALGFGPSFDTAMNSKSFIRFPSRRRRR